MLVATMPAVAEPQEILEIEVVGMNCPFCAYDIGVALLRVPGVHKTDINLTVNRAVVIMQPGQSLDESRIRAIIIAAGYKPGVSERYTTE